MSFQPFAMERWQSTWENKVRYNLSESGVHPMSAAELLALAGSTGGRETPLDLREHPLLVLRQGHTATPSASRPGNTLSLSLRRASLSNCSGFVLHLFSRS